MIILSTERNKAEERIKEKLQQSSRVENVELLSKVAYEEIDLNIQSVKEVFKGFYSEILTKNKTDTIDEIAVYSFSYRLYLDTRTKHMVQDVLQRFWYWDLLVLVNMK